jgi:hypothetical protein
MVHYYDVYLSVVQTRVLLDTTSLICALAAYGNDHGRFPDALPALVPEYVDSIPLDPFGQGEYRYRPDEEKGYILYSVGVNGADDGGLTAEWQADPLPYYLYGDFVLRRRPERRQPFIEWQTTTQPTSKPAAAEDEPALGRLDA